MGWIWSGRKWKKKKKNQIKLGDRKKQKYKEGKVKTPNGRRWVSFVKTIKGEGASTLRRGRQSSSHRRWWSSSSLLYNRPAAVTRNASIHLDRLTISSLPQCTFPWRGTVSFCANNNGKKGGRGDLLLAMGEWSMDRKCAPGGLCSALLARDVGGPFFIQFFSILRLRGQQQLPLRPLMCVCRPFTIEMCVGWKGRWMVLVRKMWME